jgi:hypothetical protein
MKKSIPFLFVGVCLFLFACGGDDAAENCADLSINFASEFSNEIQAIVNAGTAYGNDPSTSNCEAYKDAIQDYIDVLRDFEDCAREAGAEDEWLQAINEYDVNLLNNIC